MATHSERHDAKAAGRTASKLLLMLGAVMLAFTLLLVFNISVGPVTQSAAADDAESSENGQEGDEEELEKLPLELPNPVFAGTPSDIPPGARMLPPTGQPREPYLAPKGLENVALDKEVTASDDLPLVGEFSMVTDGDKEALAGRFLELAPGPQWVQIDLEDEYEIYAIMMWFNHMEPRVYRGIVVQASNDPEFEDEDAVTTLYNNDHENTVGQGAGDEYQYFESYEGKLVEGEGTVARYVRVYTNGSTQSDQNHYTEIEVWAREPRE